MSAGNDLVYELENIQYEHNGKTVLDIPYLSVEKGQISVLIGGNGAGKTTLLNLFSFLQKPSQGQISFFGNRISPKEFTSLRRRVGLVAQNPYLLRGSVLDNVAMGLGFRGHSYSERMEKASQALDVVGIGAFHDREANALSGGEKQKVTLARALALKPEVLLLDEPFNHLDQQSIQQLEDLLKRCVSDRGVSIILSTHEQLYGMAMSDQLISLVAGRLVDAPLLNTYQGRVEKNYFSTGKISIFLPEDLITGTHLIIDPVEIVLSTEALSSSMRNSYQGRVIRIAEEQGRVWVTVDTGEKFHACITHKSLHEMALTLGSSVWVNFKSTSVSVF